MLSIERIRGLIIKDENNVMYYVPLHEVPEECDHTDSEIMSTEGEYDKESSDEEIFEEDNIWQTCNDLEQSKDWHFMSFYKIFRKMLIIAVFVNNKIKKGFNVYTVFTDVWCASS